MPFVLYMLALTVFVMGTSEFVLAGLLPAIALDLDVPIGTAGLLTSAFAVGMVIGAPLMAALARRWPPRRTLPVCVAVFAGCHVVCALTPDFSIVLVMRVLSALANAGFLAVALSTATTLVSAEQKGRALAVLLSGTTLATVVGVPAGALLGTALGWRSTFWAIAVLCVPAALGVVRGIAGERGRLAHDAAVPRLRVEFGRLRSPRLILALVLAALINAGTFAALTFLAPVVTEVANVGEVLVALALASFGFGSFLGVTIAGRLSDRHPRVVLAVGGPLLLTGWIVLASIASHPVALLVLVLVQGVLAFAVGSTLITRVLYASAGAPTMGGAYATAALNVGAAAGPALGALSFVLATELGALAPIWVAAALTAIALAVMVPTGRTLADSDEGGDEGGER